MKYLVILGDGMADYPIDELDGKTPLEFANKPNMDFLAKHGELGLVKTVPDNMAPGSDIANLSVLGYAPSLYYTGRSPLEAVSIGITMSDTDVALRCNLVTLSDENDFKCKTLIDYSSDEISTNEAAELIAAVDAELSNEKFKFYKGISYRHCMVWHNGLTNLSLTPPHDITGKKISNFLPDKDNNIFILDLMKKSHEILKNHYINTNRINNGLRPANSIWLWGEGKKTSLPSYKETFGVNGSIISAVDLLKGIAISAGLNVINVEGATGNVHTNFSGKAKAALKEFENGKDFVFLHVEAPDECGHRGETENKVLSIELIDKDILGYLLKNMDQFDDYKIMVLPDHPTPLALKTHTSDPVPYVIYCKDKITHSLESRCCSSKESTLGISNCKTFFDASNPTLVFTEACAKSTGKFVEKGHELIKMFFGTIP